MLCVGAGSCFSFFFFCFFLPSNMKEQRWTVNFVVWQWQCCKQNRHVTTSLAVEAPWKFREQSLGLWVSTSNELTRCWSLTGLRAVTMSGNQWATPFSCWNTESNGQPLQDMVLGESEWATFEWPSSQIWSYLIGFSAIFSLRQSSSLSRTAKSS